MRAQSLQERVLGNGLFQVLQPSFSFRCLGALNRIFCRVHTPNLPHALDPRQTGIVQHSTFFAPIAPWRARDRTPHSVVINRQTREAPFAAETLRRFVESWSLTT